MTFMPLAILRLLPVLVLLGACAELGWNPLDPKEWDPRPPPDPGSVVAWPVDRLGAGAPIRAMRAPGAALPGRLDVRWPPAGADGRSGPRAAVVLFETFDPARRAALLADPAADLAPWPDLAARALDAGPVYRLAVGAEERAWRRAVAGVDACLFSAFVPAAAPEGLARAYFCRSAGDGLSETEAVALLARLSISGRS